MVLHPDLTLSRALDQLGPADQLDPQDHPTRTIPEPVEGSGHGRCRSDP